MEVHLAFCADLAMRVGLHVSAATALRHMDEHADVSVHVFSDKFSDTDVSILKDTLDRTGRPYKFYFKRMDDANLAGLPTLNASVAAYFRLLIPDHIDADRVLYLDSDILCKVDLAPLFDIEMGDHPIGLVPEAPISECADQPVYRNLGENAHGNYYNSGVLLMDIKKWKELDLTRKCMSYISRERPSLYDQSALNFVLHGQILDLDNRYNSYSNDRPNWKHFRRPINGEGRLLHFVDRPKPWEKLGRRGHMFGRLWYEEFKKTAAYDAHRDDCGQWPKIQGGRIPRYKKMIKDRMLFALYNARVLKPKGVGE